MSAKGHKAAVSKSEAAAVVPEPAPTPNLRTPEPAVVSSTAPAVIVPTYVDSAQLWLSALERIAHGRLCGCKGDHDSTQYDCPKSIARSALERT